TLDSSGVDSFGYSGGGLFRFSPWRIKRVHKAPPVILRLLILSVLDSFQLSQWWTLSILLVVDFFNSPGGRLFDCPSEHVMVPVVLCGLQENQRVHKEPLVIFRLLILLVLDLSILPVDSFDYPGGGLFRGGLIRLSQ
ncbi:25414_t:CDS:2, partial [Gigaspora rosea]